MVEIMYNLVNSPSTGTTQDLINNNLFSIKIHEAVTETCTMVHKSSHIDSNDTDSNIHAFN